MELDKLYLVKYNSKEFEKNTLVKYITCTYSGKCYLVENLDKTKREWLMDYNLYPAKHDKLNNNFDYDENYQTIIDNLILNH